MSAKPSFEAFLVENKLLTSEALALAQREAAQKKVSLQQILAEKRLMAPEIFTQSVAKYQGVEYRPAPLNFDAELVAKFPVFTLRRYRILPLEKDDKQIVVAAVDPSNLLAADEIRRVVKLSVKLVCASEEAILEAIARSQGGAASATQTPAATAVPSSAPSDSEVSPGAVNSSGSPAEQIVERSIQRSASDIHFEPQHGFGIVRERIDGILHEVQRLPLDQMAQYVSRLKLMAGMDVVEKRLPQDGRFKFKFSGGVTEIRGSILPVIYGEKLVLRILRSDRIEPTIQMLDIGEQRAAMLKSICEMPDGLVVVAGPTGSGKSTTLYAMLSDLDRRTQNVITVEDPVEYELPFSNQVQVNQKIGITFASTLPSILRQDPDVVLVGEIRDEPTAQMVMRTAISGHLVFSTLHAPNALSTVIRLSDMNVELHMLIAAIKATISQRLLRRLCAKCKKPYSASEIEKKTLGVDPSQDVQIFGAVGCDACHGLGYKGRFAVIEVLRLTEPLYEAIAERDRKKLSRVAKEEGFRTMHQHGLEKVLSGDTTLQELLAYCPSEE